MKKSIAVFLLLLLAGCTQPKPSISPDVTPASERLTLASFNIRIFSNASRDDAELAAIADILQKYDLIAIQELRDEEVLKRTIAILQQRGLGYAYEISPPVGRGVLVCLAPHEASGPWGFLLATRSFMARDRGMGGLRWESIPT